MGMLVRKWALIGILSAVLVPAALIAPTASGVGAPPTENSMASRKVLDEYELALVPVEDSEIESLPAYAGLANDPANMQIDLYWVGERTASLGAWLKSAPAGVTVTIHPAIVTVADANRARDRIHSALGDSQIEIGVDVCGISRFPLEGRGPIVGHQKDANKNSAIPEDLSNAYGVEQRSPTVARWQLPLPNRNMKVGGP